MPMRAHEIGRDVRLTKAATVFNGGHHHPPGTGCVMEPYTDLNNGAFLDFDPECMDSLALR